jgi:predicted metal-binding membrane protein
VYDIREHRLRAAAALRWRPDWPFAVLVALAWVVLLIGPGGQHEDQSHTGKEVAAVHLPAHGLEHEHEHGSARPVADPIVGDRHKLSSNLPAALLHWTLMTIAMMVPVALPAVRHVGLNSVRRRRLRAMLLFVTVYVGTWSAFGLAALAGTRLAYRALGIDDRVLLALALAVAAGWQLSRTKRRALFRCWRTAPLPPVGLRADAGCARFALLQGSRCVSSCWSLMVIMTVVQHMALVWMMALTALIVAEELTVLGRRLLRPSAVALAVVAGLVALAI